MTGIVNSSAFGRVSVREGEGWVRAHQMMASSIAASHTLATRLDQALTIHLLYAILEYEQLNYA